ncbi:hypothetical protein G3545_21975 [Starkeya sp. ORNL1]|uniref:hypothetical protein n=1 Tax=Starkeya sp. ORNL1 TaxID=2709380 RepID=UPI00146325DF|nr:hypothetical protein [Starkeya sp. ORNL1]QJP16074.1 hypothetical protein G3545_21975 [Starkeya sp. ORNL1]
MPVEAASSGPRDLLWLSALLAGLGPQARAARAALAGGEGPEARARTCIDGGSPALIAVHAPGRRTWEAHVMEPDAGDGERRSWHGMRWAPGGKHQALHRTLYRSRRGDAAVAARHAAAAHGPQALEHFERFHARLGPSGLIYSVGTDPEDGGGPRVAWQLDRHVDAAALVEGLLDLADWRQAVAAIGAVQGIDFVRGAGPWSISIAPAAPQRGVRIGSTRWARAVDDAEKRRRFAAWIGGLGGDGAYAAGLYQLLDEARPQGSLESIGRAVEVDLAAGSVIAARAYLAVPRAPHPRPPASAGLSERSELCLG